jgi:general secretion pathway protein C
MLSRWSAFLVWALVAASAVAWGLRILARPLPVPPQASLAQAAMPAGGDWARVFGAAPAPSPVVAEAAPPPPEASRFQLIGVVAARPPAARGQGLALIAVDGRLPRAYRVGAVVDGEHVLQSVQPRAVAIGPRQGPPVVTLELPVLPPPATGTPGLAAAPAAGAMPGAMPPPVAMPPAATWPPTGATGAAVVPSMRPRPQPGLLSPGQAPAPMSAVPVEPSPGADGQPPPSPAPAQMR